MKQNIYTRGTKKKKKDKKIYDVDEHAWLSLQNEYTGEAVCLICDYSDLLYSYSFLLENIFTN